MNFEDLFEVTGSEVECEEAPFVAERSVQAVQRRRFSFDCVPYSQEPAIQNVSEAEVLKRLDVLQGLQKDYINRLAIIETALKENVPDKSEVQAQSKLLRECRVIGARTHQAISRITGDMEDEEYLDLASKLPMSSIEHLATVEEKLKNRASADVMMRLLVKARGVKGTVDGVLRTLLHDDLARDYDLEGRKGKKSLISLKCVDIVFDVFAEKPKQSVLDYIRRYVALSHNRHKQKLCKLKKKVVLSVNN
ncbi:uncharacterized protein [Eurosta solidaginis]|uniref:uncharacterized protein n=1 Tax=Eurosta solidaginis TaxID=178769 RepID=UPI0035312E5B